MILALTEISLLLAQTAGEIDPEAGEFNLFLFLLLVVAMVAFSILAVIGVLIALVIAATSGALVFTGAALSSAIVAAVRRSPSVGFILFVVQLSAVAGAILGGTVGMLYARSQGLPLFHGSWAGLGALIGATVLALMSWLSIKLWFGIWMQIRTWWTSRRAATPRA
jgi:hypothetical protein